MIQNEAEYLRNLKKLQDSELRLAARRTRLRRQAVSSAAREAALLPLREEIRALRKRLGTYERMKEGGLAEVTDLRDVGQQLVTLRVARGVTQRELARRLAVCPSQVSRDERTGYHGITLERAARILDALGLQIKSMFLALKEEGTPA